MLKYNSWIQERAQKKISTVKDIIDALDDIDEMICIREEAMTFLLAYLDEYSTEQKETSEIVFELGLILARKPNLEERIESNGHTPLMNAVARIKRTEVVKLLLDAGAEVNAIDHYNYTPFDMAVDRCLNEIAELLLNHGADTNSGRGIDSMVDCISKTNCDDKQDDFAKVIFTALENGFDVNSNVGESSVFMMYFAVHRKYNIMRQIMNSKFGGDIRYELFDSLAQRGGHLDVMLNCLKHRQFDLFKIFREKGVQISFDALKKLLFCSNSYDIIKSIVLDGVLDLSIFKDENSGITLMHVATDCKDSSLLDLLIEIYPHLIHVQNNLGQTPLHHANDNTHMRTALLKAGADPECKDDFDRTYLYYVDESNGEDDSSKYFDSDEEW